MSSPPVFSRLSVFSWALYDFANTIFSMNVLSLYFALWFIQDHGGKDLHYSLTYVASMAVVILFAPVLGLFADLTNRRRLFLVLSTCACVAATALIGILNDVGWGLFFFFTANIAYQLALVFYDGLLPSVTDPQGYGRISGLGVALGYAGSIAGIVMVSFFVHAGSEVLRHRAFVPTAVLFLLFSLPCFLWVKEIKQKAPERPRGSLWYQNLRTIRKYPGVPPFLITMFLVQNAVNTVILFMGIYSAEVGGMGQSAINLFFVIATVTALASALIFGKFTDRFGPRRMLGLVLWIWLAALMIAAFSPRQEGLWIAGCLIGTGLGGLWTTSRPLLLTLIPKEESATFFGFNVLAGRFAAILGPLAWGLTVWLGEPLGVLRYRLAVAVLIVFLLAGFYAFKFIPGPARNDRT